jgi:hypothetical protein
MDITGARWSLDGAEAILKLRTSPATATSTGTGPGTSPRNNNASTTAATSAASFHSRQSPQKSRTH